MKKIEVIRKSDNALVAGDFGENVTVQSLKEKMISKFDITDSDLYEIQESNDFSQEIEVLYNQMLNDIYDEVENVFGTRSDVTASANVSTYEAMIKRPGNFIDETLGLTTEQEVLNFANDKMSLIDSFGIFRLKRIKQFETERAALIGQ